MESNIQDRIHGGSIENPVYVLARDKLEGIGFEYEYLLERYGKDAELLQHNILRYGERVYDELLFILPNGSKQTVYFDVTSVHNKSRRRF